MRYNKIIAAALCLSMAFNGGCSAKSEKGSESATVTSNSDGIKRYELTSFSFELGDDFTVKDTRDDSDGIYRYEFEADGFTTFEVCSDAVCVSNCTAQVAAQSFYEDLMDSNSETEKHSDVEKETIDVPGMDAAWVHMNSEYPDMGVKQGESDLYITTEAHGFWVLATYDDQSKRDDVKALLRDIAATVKYTSDDRLPTEQQSYENDFFSLAFGPEWKMKDISSKNGENIIIKLSYYYSQDMEHYVNPSLDIGVILEDKGSAEEAADHLYDLRTERESKLYSEVERGKDEILGYPAETVSYVLDLSTGKSRNKKYYFTENGHVYSITEVLNMRDEEGSKAELEAILENVKIKKS